jgi:hypothetical protein
MKLTFKQLAFFGVVGFAIVTPQVVSAAPVDFNQATLAKPIDLSKAKLLLEIIRVETVSKTVHNYADQQGTLAFCSDKKNCDPSEEDRGELEARKFEERWWADDSGDEWYEKTEYHKYENDNTWEDMGGITVKEGAAGFVPRPKG